MMNSRFPDNKQQDLIDELGKRFPVFRQLVGQFDKDTKEERIPWFFGLFLSAAQQGHPGAYCFVVDKTSGTTAVAAVLMALVKLRDEFPKLARDYAQTVLRPGQRVRVKPHNFVYEYGGLWEDNPDFFKLIFLDEETSSRTFPLDQVLRLEPTDHLRPKGKGEKLGDCKPSRLDELLNLTTCGNNSLIENTVLLHMPQARFEKIMGAITLAPEQKVDGFDPLSAYLPWGSIGPEGELKPNDPYQVSGEPIVAVTRVPEDLEKASRLAPSGTKVVLVDGSSNVVRDFQAFDDVADRQRVLIFASPEETEALELLKDRDCPIWHMSPDEILIGESPDVHRTRTSLVGATIEAAWTRRVAEVNKVNCQDSKLQAFAEALERAAAVTEAGGEVHESEEILARLFGILLECSECCFGVGDETRANLRNVRELVNQHAKYLEPTFFREIRSAITKLEGIIDVNSFGEKKAEALRDILLAPGGGQWVVAARSPRTAESLRRGLRDLGIDVPVRDIPALRTDKEYEGIVVPAWPNRQRFSRLTNLAITADIHVLIYPFEGKWLQSHLASENARFRSNLMDVEVRSSILGIDSDLLTDLNSNGSKPPIPPSPDEPIFRIVKRVAKRRHKPLPVADDSEDSREAQVVHFAGNRYALMTEWAKLPRLNRLIDDAHAGDARLEYVKASQLSPGDFVLFRDAGDKEFTRLIAEDSLGIEMYGKVRGIAERWKSALWCLGTSANDIRNRLRGHGLDRNPATIAIWLGNPELIGPRDFGDIEVIARAAGDSELLSIRQQVEEAITRIRSAHTSAGHQLTQLILGELGGRLNELDDQPELLNLEYGTAWVVQVDMINSTKEQYPSKLVNCLLCVDDDVAFQG